MNAEQRAIRAAEAQQSLNDRHWKEAFEAVKGYLVANAESCDPDNKEKAQRIILSLQLLEAVKREVHRKVEDGEFARVELKEIEKRQGLRLFRR